MKRWSLNFEWCTNNDSLVDLRLKIDMMEAVKRRRENKEYDGPG